MRNIFGQSGAGYHTGEKSSATAGDHVFHVKNIAIAAANTTLP